MSSEDSSNSDLIVILPTAGKSNRRSLHFRSRRTSSTRSSEAEDDQGWTNSNLRLIVFFCVFNRLRVRRKGVAFCPLPRCCKASGFCGYRLFLCFLDGAEGKQTIFYIKNAPFKNVAKWKHPFHLATYTWYLLHYGKTLWKENAILKHPLIWRLTPVISM